MLQRKQAQSLSLDAQLRRGQCYTRTIAVCTDTQTIYDMTMPFIGPGPKRPAKHQRQVNLRLATQAAYVDLAKQASIVGQKDARNLPDHFLLGNEVNLTLFPDENTIMWQWEEYAQVVKIGKLLQPATPMENNCK